jgi:perosamine synthetase
MTATIPFCGDLATAFNIMPRHHASGGVPALFSGRRVSYSFNTRVAIRKALDILKLGPGDEVLAPAYNCGSELDPLRLAGITIRLYPISLSTGIDPEQVERLIGARTRAIYLTHYFGFLQPEMAAIRQLCDARGLHLVEDCALSLLSGKAPAEGRTGDISVFCFYKFFPVLAGGALVVNTGSTLPEAAFARPAPGGLVAKRLLQATVNSVLGPGRAARILKRAKGEDRVVGTSGSQSDLRPDMPGHYYFDPGLTDARMSVITSRALSGFDVAATIGVRRANYLRLLDGLSGIPGVSPLFPDLPMSAVPLSMPLRVSGGHRNALVARLQAEGIAATPWWSGYNRQLDFSDSAQADLSSARTLKDTVLSLPIHQYIGPAGIDHIATRLREIHHHITKT